MFRLLTILAAIAAVAVSAATESAGGDDTLGGGGGGVPPTESISWLGWARPSSRGWGTGSGGEVISDFVKTPLSLNTFGGNDT